MPDEGREDFSDPKVVRAGAEMDLSPSDGNEGGGAILRTSGRFFVELADGRRFRVGVFGSSYGAFFGERRVRRSDLEKSISRLLREDARVSPWRQLSRVLSQEGVSVADVELSQLPFEIECSEDLLERLDRA
jgi:hypothetical protein